VEEGDGGMVGMLVLFAQLERKVLEKSGGFSTQASEARHSTVVETAPAKETVTVPRCVLRLTMLLV